MNALFNTQIHNGNPIPTEIDATRYLNWHCLTSGSNWVTEVGDEEVDTFSSASTFTIDYRRTQES